MLQRLTDVLHYPFGRVRRFVLVHMLHANDPPHRLALGAAIGVFVAITPTVGIQMALVLVLAYLLRANKVVGLPIVWMTNPATIVPIYYSCYYIGRRMLNQEGIGREWWAELRGTHNFTFYWEKLVEVALPLWLGCLVVATVSGYATYYVTYFMVRQYRLKRWGQLTPPEHELGEAALQRPEQGAAAERENAKPAEASCAPTAPPDINSSGGETDHLPTTIE